MPLPLTEHQLCAGHSTGHFSNPVEWNSDILQGFQIPTHMGKTPLSLVHLKLPLSISLVRV